MIVIIHKTRNLIILVMAEKLGSCELEFKCCKISEPQVNMVLRIEDLNRFKNTKTKNLEKPSLLLSIQFRLIPILSYSCITFPGCS